MAPSTLRVLIIGAPSERRRAVRKLLSSAVPPTYTITEASQGDNAIAICLAEPPDCVLLDDHLPDRASLDVLAALRARSDVPVVLLTDIAHEAVAAEAIARGAQEYVLADALTALRLHATVQHAIAAVRLTREHDHALAQSATAQSAATQAHARLEALINSAPNGIAYLDRELRYILINPSLAALNGQTPQAHLGRTLAEVIPGMDTILEPLLRQVLATGQPATQLEVHGRPCPRDGVVHEWLVSTFPVPDQAGGVAGVGVILTDLTQRKRTEAALRASEERFRLLAENADDVIYRMKLLAPMVIEYLSPAVERMTGYPHEAFKDQQFIQQLIDADSRRIVEEQLRDAATVRRPLTLRWRHRDGRSMWAELQSWIVADETGQPLAIEGIARDITARKQAEDALRESETRYRTLFETISLGIVYHDATGKAIAANPAAERILGLEPSQLLGYSVREVGWKPVHEDGTSFSKEDHPALVALRTGQVVRDVVMGLVYPGLAVVRWLRIQAMPQTQPGATAPEQVYTIFEDITEKRRVMRALEEHTDALSRSNAELARALRLKDAFLAMISHELRTPLNAILGYTEAIEEGLYGDVNERQRQALTQVSQSGRHLLGMLSEILDLAHIEAGVETLELGPINVEALCRSAMQLVQIAAQQKGLHLLRGIEQGVDCLRADERRLIQILVNLLDNAVKFTPTGGTVGLEVRADHQHELIEFVVWDTGIGIAEEGYDRLFQPFSQIDGRLARQYGGIGLGLMLVRRLTELHGGSVALESTPGQGSRFTIRLPWSADDNVAPRADSAAPLPAPRWTKPPRVVLADDHEITLALYRDLLTQQGCQVSVARTGEEALAQIREQRPDIAVLDIQMPVMDGLAVIRHLRADPEFVTLPVIALTALAMPGDRERCLATGAHAYLAKPVGVRTLLATMAALLPEASSPAGS